MDGRSREAPSGVVDAAPRWPRAIDQLLRAMDQLLRRCVLWCVTEWKTRPSPQRRALVFILVFCVLVIVNAMGSPDAAAPGGAVVQVGAGVLPKIGFHQGALVADVGAFTIVATADNDGAQMPQQQPMGQKMTTTSLGAVTGIVTGKLQRNSETKRWTVTWDPHVSVVHGEITAGGRGMELSTLQYWREGRLFACDDRTGIVYELLVQEGSAPKAIPRHILASGNGNTTRGMRCEWSTVKGDLLFVGSTGRPMAEGPTNDGNDDAVWIKTVSPLGDVHHLDWSSHYGKLRAAIGIGQQSNGYVVHECAVWSRARHQWVFVPRHVSSGSSRSRSGGDERKHGSTVIIFSDASFSRTRIIALPPMQSSSTPFGVTDCKLIPSGRDDELVLIKAVEREDGRFESLLAIVGIDGTLLMDDVPMPTGWKFEAVELRPML